MSTTVILNDDQSEIRDVARRMLGNDYGSERVREIIEGQAPLPAEDWQAIAELGWIGISLPEEQGGAGYGTIERCLLLEEIGRVAMPGPFLSSAVLAIDVLAGAGAPDLAADLLAEVVTGVRQASVVIAGDLHAGTSAAGAVVATATGEGFSLSGDGGVVLDGDSADVLLVAARAGDETGLFAVGGAAKGVSRSSRVTVDQTRRFAAITFNGAVAQRIDRGADTEAALDHALDRARIALCADSVGGAQRLLDMTVEYAKDREQFGVPIGSFQAVKHRLADVAVQVDAARELVLYAADVVDGGDPAELPALVAATKAAVSDAYVRAGAEAIQLHGGIGFTWEHDAHLFYKRALVSARLLGTAVDQCDRLAELLGV